MPVYSGAEASPRESRRHGDGLLDVMVRIGLAAGSSGGFLVKPFVTGARQARMAWQLGQGQFERERERASLDLAQRVAALESKTSPTAEHASPAEPTDGRRLAALVKDVVATMTSTFLTRDELDERLIVDDANADAFYATKAGLFELGKRLDAALVEFKAATDQSDQLADVLRRVAAIEPQLARDFVPHGLGTQLRGMQTDLDDLRAQWSRWLDCEAPVGGEGDGMISDVDGQIDADDDGDDDDEVSIVSLQSHSNGSASGDDLAMPRAPSESAGAHRQRLLEADIAALAIGQRRAERVATAAKQDAVAARVCASSACADATTAKGIAEDQRHRVVLLEDAHARLEGFNGLNGAHITEARGVADGALAAANAAHTDLADLTTRTDDLASRLDGVAERMPELTAVGARLGRVDFRLNQAMTLAEQVDGLVGGDSGLGGLIGQCADLRQRVAALEAGSADFFGTARQSAATFTRVLEQFDQLGVGLSRAETAHAVLRVDHDALVAKHDALAGRVDALAAEVAGLRSAATAEAAPDAIQAWLQALQRRSETSATELARVCEAVDSSRQAQAVAALASAEQSVEVRRLLLHVGLEPVGTRAIGVVTPPPTPASGSQHDSSSDSSSASAASRREVEVLTYEAYAGLQILAGDVQRLEARASRSAGSFHEDGMGRLVTRLCARINKIEARLGAAPPPATPYGSAHRSL